MTLESHLRDEALRSVFEHLLNEVNSGVGRCEVLSLPCCIHLVGGDDFLAVLPRKERLEIRFALEHELKNPRVKRSARIGRKLFKHSVDVRSVRDIDEVLLDWIREAYLRTSALRPAPSGRSVRPG